MPATRHTANDADQAALRKRELALIHMGKTFLARQAGMSPADYDSDYRQMLRDMGGGKSSAAQLDGKGRQAILAHMKSKGFKVVARPGRSAKPGRAAALPGPMAKKLRAMWYALADVGAVERPGSALACDAAVEAWAKRQLPQLDALRFADGAQLNKLVEEMKAWGMRVKARIY